MDASFELETPRLRLRAWRDEDLEAYAAMTSDPATMRFMGSGPLTCAEAEEQIVRFRRGPPAVGGAPHAAAELKATGELVGRIGLFHQPDWPGPDQVEVGWLLAREHWGRGYATEGARATLAFAFERLGLARVISLALPENTRSRAVMERLGMTIRGREDWRGREHVWYALDRPAAGPAIP